MNLFGGIVDRYYERQDRFIGEIVERAGPEATILVVSDHGFSRTATGRRTAIRDRQGNAADWHTPSVSSSWPARHSAGVDIGSASSSTSPRPSWRSTAFLPRATWTDAAAAALLPRFLEAHPLAWVDTYGGIRQAPQDLPRPPPPTTPRSWRSSGTSATSARNG